MAQSGAKFLEAERKKKRDFQDYIKVIGENLILFPTNARTLSYQKNVHNDIHRTDNYR